MHGLCRADLPDAVEQNNPNMLKLFRRDFAEPRKLARPPDELVGPTADADECLGLLAGGAPTKRAKLAAHLQSHEEMAEIVSRVMAPPTHVPTSAPLQRVQACSGADAMGLGLAPGASKELAAVLPHKHAVDVINGNQIHSKQTLPISPIDEGLDLLHQVSLAAHTPPSNALASKLDSDEQQLPRQLSDPPSNRSLILDTPESLLQDPNSSSRENCAVTNPIPSPGQAQAPILNSAQPMHAEAAELSFQGFNPGSEKLAPALDALIRADSMLQLHGPGHQQLQSAPPAIAADGDFSGRVSPCMTDASLGGHTVPDTPDDSFQRTRFPWMAQLGSGVAQAGVSGALPGPASCHTSLPFEQGMMQPQFPGPVPSAQGHTAAASVDATWPGEELLAPPQQVGYASSELWHDASATASPSAPKKRRRNRNQHDIDPAFEVGRPGSAMQTMSPSTDGSGGAAHPWQSLGGGTPSTAADGAAPPSLEMHVSAVYPQHDDITPVCVTCAPAAGPPGPLGLGSSGSDGQPGHPSAVASHVSPSAARERQISTWLSEKIATVLKSKCAHTTLACIGTYFEPVVSYHA